LIQYTISKLYIVIEWSKGINAYSNDDFTADTIFADMGFVVDPHVAAKFPFLSIKILLKFQDGTKPTSSFNDLKNGCALLPFILVVVLIGIAIP
jgi:hypothetical protein